MKIKSQTILWKLVEQTELQFSGHFPSVEAFFFYEAPVEGFFVFNEAVSAYLCCLAELSAL